MEKNQELKNIIELGIKFHGHKCPAMPLGIRAGIAAMKKLEVKRAKNKELFCFIENGPSHAMMCFTDGVQVATGCTYGKGNIKKLNYGKTAITLIDIKNKKSIRVILKPEFQKNAFNSEFLKLRKKGIEPQDIKEEIVEPLIEKIISLKDEELFIIEDIKKNDFNRKKGTFYWEECEKCKEIVFEPGLRIKEGKHYCIPCLNSE